MRFLKTPSWRNPANAGKQRGQARKRVLPWWRSRHARIGLPCAGAVLAAVAVWMVVQSGWPGRATGYVLQTTVDATVKAGLQVREIFVVGRKETSRQAITDALGIERGAPILVIDLEAAQARVAALPWVRNVSLERVLPDAIIVRIRERQPLALWQRNGMFAVIDSEGYVIDDRNVGRFNHLVVLVGDDAPRHAGDFVAMLSGYPILSQRVLAGVRRGGRRWDIRLGNGIDIRLPEADAGEALDRLVEYQARHDVLGRHIKVLDLRFRDQVIVRRAVPAQKLSLPEGRET